MRLTPSEWLSAPAACSVAVISADDAGDFGARLGRQMVNSLLPGEAEVHHLTLHTLGEARGNYDLVVLGTGNGLFPTLLGEEVLDVVSHAKAAIGIFGTQSRELISRPALDRLIDRLDTWFARYEDDVLMYGRGRRNVVHLGDWLIDQFPLARPINDEPLMISDEVGQEFALDRAIRTIQQHKQVYSTLPYRVAVRAHLGRACGLRRAIDAAIACRRPVPQHVDRYFRPCFSGAEILPGRPRRCHPVQGARPPQCRQGRRAHRVRSCVTWRSQPEIAADTCLFSLADGLYSRRHQHIIASFPMAGHSQFKNIMHRKGRQDKVRSKLFGKLAREITVSAKLGLPDPAFNPRLRAAIIAARAENMPKDNIDRAIKKSQGADTESYDEIRYEGYGPGGVAIIVEALTDNRNRTAGEVRAIFAKNGGNLAETGAVSFMFSHVGIVEYDAKAASADAMLEAAIDAGAEDVVSNDDGHQVITTPDTLATSPKRWKPNSASRASRRCCGSRKTLSRWTTNPAKRF